MDFGGARRSAAAVASRSTAEQNNDIVRVGSLSNDIPARRRAHDRADFHSLCHIIGMIDFLDKAGREANLVSIGRITARRAAHQLLLGQLAL